MYIVHVRVHTCTLYIHVHVHTCTCTRYIVHVQCTCLLHDHNWDAFAHACTCICTCTCDLHVAPPELKTYHQKTLPVCVAMRERKSETASRVALSPCSSENSVAEWERAEMREGGLESGQSGGEGTQ